MEYIEVKTDREEQRSSSSPSSSSLFVGGPCVVCAQAAHGIHFGVATCRACAAFFRRTVVLDRKYTCRRLNADCNISLEVRYLCRFCRYQRCLQVGMTPDNVQWNRDRMSSSIQNKEKLSKGKKNAQKMDVEERIERMAIKEDEEDGERSRIMGMEGMEIREKPLNPLNPQSSIIRPKPNPPQQIARLIGHILDISRKIELVLTPNRAIEVVSPFPLTALQRMSIATERLRGELPKEPPVVLEEVDFEVISIDWFQHLEKTAYWLMHCEEYARLPLEQKMLIFRNTWSGFLRMEKIASTLLVFGEEAVRRKVCLCCDFATSLTTKVHMGDLSNLSSEDFSKFMAPKMEVMFEDLARPMLMMGPEPLEYIYLLCLTVWNIEGRGLSVDTVHAADLYRERISAELHDFYVHSKGLTNYAHRMIQLHSLIQNNERIQQERNEMWTMVRVFDVFNFELPNCGVLDPERM
ncbi:unnamed protein product, partial [Mesorhabditis belari]|uniref:Uncharacterized protein n=1 Tax=Mesorhabditis belari TaxID=2138241 RepID=A0AAF3FFS8_9BILA